MSFEPVSFSSTNHRAPRVGLREALLKGQAPDQGLYMPERVVPLSSAELLDLAGRPYPEVAFQVLRRFTAGVMEDSTLDRLCRDVHDYPVPLEHVAGRLHVMRLDRGPTASFKDFAARVMARWMRALVEPGAQELVILTATSGDTGSAVAHAFFGLSGVRSLVLFPKAEVSDRQRRQMTTLGGNVQTYAVDGTFDDCQALVKRAFADPDLASLPLTSANSVNIGRLLPQAVYYVYAYVNVADVAGGERVVFSVPSGNFGNLTGAMLARLLGVPIRRLIVATNANDEFPRYLLTGTYEKIVPARACLSRAMDVGHPSNLARLVDLYGGHMDSSGTIHHQPDLELMRRELAAASISDDETRVTIREAWERHRLLLEPHGAVGWAGLQRHLGSAEAGETLAVSLETAHPAKFPDEIRALLGFDPELPPSLAGLDARTEHYGTLTPDYETFRDLLLCLS